MLSDKLKENFVNKLHQMQKCATIVSVETMLHDLPLEENKKLEYDNKLQHTKSFKNWLPKIDK